MFLSANSPNFLGDRRAELVKFVLERDAKYLPSYIRVYAFYTLDHAYGLLAQTVS